MVLLWRGGGEPRAVNSEAIKFFGAKEGEGGKKENSLSLSLSRCSALSRSMFVQICFAAREGKERKEGDSPTFSGRLVLLARERLPSSLVKLTACFTKNRRIIFSSFHAISSLVARSMPDGEKRERGGGMRF